MKDNYIVLLLAGMLAYKFLDMWVNQLKISQSLLRFDRLINPLSTTVSPRRAMYRMLRKKCNKSLAKTLLRRHRFVSRASYGFADLLMISLLIVVSIVLVGVQLVDYRTHGSYILGSATIIVSVITSSVAVLMESLREAIERI